MAFSAAGDILAMEVEDLFAAGAYSQYPRSSIAEGNQIICLCGAPYRLGVYRAELRMRAGGSVALKTSESRADSGSGVPRWIIVPYSDRLQSRYVHERFEQVPVLPQVVLGIAALDGEAPDFTDQVEFLARHDPMLALRLLRLANAARRAPGAPDIVDLGACMARIGSRALCTSFQALTVVPVFLPSRPGQRDLWLHSLQAAVGARDLALAHEQFGVDPEVAYVTGLVHDLGRFLVLERAANELDAVDAAGWDSPDALVARESGLFGYDHTQIGALACERWALPGMLRQVVAHHHDDALPASLARDEYRLVRVVQLADRLSVAMMRGGDGPGVVRESDVVAIREHMHALDPSLRWTSPQRLTSLARRVHAIGAQMACNIMPTLSTLGFAPEPGAVSA